MSQFVQDGAMGMTNDGNAGEADDGPRARTYFVFLGQPQITTTSHLARVMGLSPHRVFTITRMPMEKSPSFARFPKEEIKSKAWLPVLNPDIKKHSHFLTPEHRTSF
jgi:hypothetical protein